MINAVSDLPRRNQFNVLTNHFPSTIIKSILLFGVVNSVLLSCACTCTVNGHFRIYTGITTHKNISV